MTTYHIEEAKSNRAACKNASCKQKIDKDVLRVGMTKMRDEHPMVSWYHLKSPADETISCFQGPKVAITTDDFTSGVELLNADDLAFLQDALEWKPPVKKQKIADNAPEMLDPAWKALYEKYSKKTATVLKIILKNNKMVQAGNKEEVVRRCVDGEQHGAYPRCPTCTKQTVKPNKAGDGFVCPGTFEEGSMIKCMFKAETVERLTWNDSEVAVAHEEEEVKPDAAGDAAMAANFAGLDPKAAATKLVELAGARELAIPKDETKARQIVGPVLLATANSDSSWNPAEALRALEKTHPKKVAMAADECACADNRQLISNLQELGTFLRTENTFKGNAFFTAANALKELDFKITSGKALAKAGENKVKGIGKSIAEVIDEWLENGVIANLETFRKQ